MEGGPLYRLYTAEGEKALAVSGSDRRSGERRTRRGICNPRSDEETVCCGTGQCAGAAGGDGRAVQ